MVICLVRQGEEVKQEDCSCFLFEGNETRNRSYVLLGIINRILIFGQNIIGKLTISIIRQFIYF